MAYRCVNCSKSIPMEESIRFCPYCGSQELISEVQTGGQSEIASTLDAIWGTAAQDKQDFADLVSRSLGLAGQQAAQQLEEAILPDGLTKCTERVDNIQASPNRRVLLTRIDSFLEELKQQIGELPEDTLALSSRLSSISAEYRQTVQRICETVGFALPEAEAAEAPVIRVSILYSRAQLYTFYEKLLEAYAKYRRCVQDNNMFAAFPPDFHYGSLRSFLCREWGLSLSQEEKAEDGKCAGEIPPEEYEQALSELEQANALPYTGTLDEDFAPHTNAFWKALLQLCGFIDHCLSIDYDENYFFLPAPVKSKIRRYILSGSYRVTEEKIIALEWLADRCEKAAE